MDESLARSLAAKVGLSMQYVIKENKLFEALSKILNAKTELQLILKGGTALNKIYFSGIQRFSEDIDFDCFGDNRTERLQRIIESVEGFKVEGPWKTKGTLRYHLGYSFLGRTDHIRVEFSLDKELKALNSVSYENMQSEVTGSVLYRVPVYSFDDLIARKMNALRTRSEGKDVWDCFHAIPKAKNLKEAIGFALESEGIKLSADDALDQTIAKLRSADPKQLMKLTNPYIPTSLRPKDWAGIVEDIIRYIKLVKEGKRIAP
jgi:predicted nucleotidyltransferase component of viral defense system